MKTLLATAAAAGLLASPALAGALIYEPAPQAEVVAPAPVAVLPSWTGGYVGGQLGTDQVLFFEPRYTSISRVKASSAGVRSLHSLNEAPHLD